MAKYDGWSAKIPYAHVLGMQCYKFVYRNIFIYIVDIGNLFMITHICTICNPVQYYAGPCFNWFLRNLLVNAVHLENRANVMIGCKIVSTFCWPVLACWCACLVLHVCAHSRLVKQILIVWWKMKRESLRCENRFKELAALDVGT